LVERPEEAKTAVSAERWGRIGGTFWREKDISTAAGVGDVLDGSDDPLGRTSGFLCACGPAIESDLGGGVTISKYDPIDLS
jgi:hypothetical protein